MIRRFVVLSNYVVVCRYYDLQKGQVGELQILDQVLVVKVG